MAGFAIAMLLAPMLNDSVWKQSSNQRVLDPLVAPRRRILAAVPVVYVVVWWGAPLFGVGYPIIVAVAVLATLTCVNMVMVCITPRFERKAHRLVDVWPAALVALVLAVRRDMARRTAAPGLGRARGAYLVDLSG